MKRPQTPTPNTTEKLRLEQEQINYEKAKAVVLGGGIVPADAQEPNICCSKLLFFCCQEFFAFKCLFWSNTLLINIYVFLKYRLFNGMHVLLVLLLLLSEQLETTYY